MLSEQFSQGTSLLHRLDPRGKIFVATIFSLVVAVAEQFVVLLFALAVVLILAGMARLPLKEVVRRLLIVNIFIFFLWIILPLTLPGFHHFGLGSLGVSVTGVLLAAKITLKSNTIFLGFLSLVATSSLNSLGHALHHLTVPEKFVHLLLFTYRYIHVIEHEYKRLYQAASIRGFRPSMSLHTYRTYANMIGMLLVRSFARAERVHEAMICRSFKGRLHSLHHFEFVGKDIFFLGIMLLATIWLVYLEWLKTL